jgi:hypothetical protein
MPGADSETHEAQGDFYTVEEAAIAQRLRNAEVRTMRRRTV